MVYVRTRSAALTTIRQTLSIRRDLIILTRLVLVFTFVNTVALPHVVIPIVYATSGYIPEWASPFEWLTTIVSLVFVSIIQVFTTPQLRKLWIRTHRVHVETLQVRNTTL